MVAISATVLIGFVALSLDFSRMYLFRAELKTLSDAAVISAVIDMFKGEVESTAETLAIALASANRVEGAGVASITASDIVPVTWTFATRTQGSAASWSAANAVSVTTRHTSSWTFARMFGSSTRNLSATSVAAFGSVTGSSCIKPFAIPYTSLLGALGYTTFDLSHDLTAAEVVSLGATRAEITLRDMKNALADLSAPGNFGWVDTNIPNTPNGANKELAASIDDCMSTGIAVGQYLDAIPGNRHASFVSDAMEALCGGTSTCNAAYPPVLLPIIDQAVGTASTASYRIKYIGAFKFTRMDDDNLYGYLTTMSIPATGALSDKPGPVVSAAIVK